MPINRDFFKRWSREMAYVLGFLYADGNITDAISSRTQYIGFANTDKALLTKIKSALQSEHRIQFRPPRFAKHYNGKSYLSRKSFILRIGSRSMFTDLLRRGVVPRKSKIAIFPKVPDRLLGHFIRGYFDGDGCIYLEHALGKCRRNLIKRMRVIFTSGSKQFLIGLRNAIAHSIAIRGNDIYYEHRTFRLVYGTLESNLLCNFMYRDRGVLFLRRKYNAFVHFGNVRQKK